MPAKKQKITVSGTKTKKKAAPKLTDAQKKAKEARKRLDAFLTQGLKRLREDMTLIEQGLELINHEQCPSCRCAEAADYLMDEPGRYLAYFEDYLGEALHRADNPAEELW